MGCIYIGGGITWGRGQAKEGKQNKEKGEGANRPRVPLGLGLERGRRRPGAAPGARAGWVFGPAGLGPFFNWIRAQKNKRKLN